MLKEAKAIKPVYKSYEQITGEQLDPNDPTVQMLGMAQSQLNARNPFAAAVQRGILGSQAGAMAGMQRAITDPSQALAMTAALQAQTDQSMFGQAQQEQQAYANRQAGLMEALSQRSAENKYRFGTGLQKYQMDTDMKTALRNAGRQTQLGAIQGFEDAGLKIISALLNPVGAAKKTQ